jgi:hypothetical protein
MIPIVGRGSNSNLLLANQRINNSERITGTFNSEYLFKIEENEIFGLIISEMKISLNRILYLHNLGNHSVMFNKPKLGD